MKTTVDFLKRLTKLINLEPGLKVEKITTEINKIRNDEKDFQNT